MDGIAIENGSAPLALLRQWNATCADQSQPADELGNVTYLMYLIGCGYPSGKMPYFSRSGDE